MTVENEEEVTTTEETVAEEVVEQVEETTTEEAVEVVEEIEQAEEVDEPKKAALPKGVQKRIDKITRQKHDAERHIQALEDQLAKRPEAQPANTAKPTLEQFDYDDEKYVDALTDWKVHQAIQNQNKQNAEVTRRSQQEQVYQDFETKRQSTLVQGVTAYDDFEEVAIENPDLTITPQMAHVITGSDIGHEIAYYLGSNTAEAANIAKLQPLDQAAAVAKLETKLASKPAKKISNAAAPIKPVGAKGSTSTKIDPKKDYAKWAAARNKEEFGH